MTISAARITIPTKPTSFYEDLQALVKASGPNRNEQAINLITVCIEARYDTISHIMDWATRLGFHPGHIGSILRTGIGNRWRCAEESIYTLI